MQTNSWCWEYHCEIASVICQLDKTLRMEEIQCQLLG